MTPKDHNRWMKRCLLLAAKGQSRVSPNPRVGAVVVGQDGMLLGSGYHRIYGGDHAERIALRQAAERFPARTLEQATLYVNLEPCNHTGKTPPCTEAVLQHNIPRVVVGMMDPNPTAGGGIAALRAHGVDVVAGCMEHECRRLNEAFLHRLVSRRPLVTLKIAQTLDGRVATVTGASQWITGPDAQFAVHRLRADMDGILVGSGTARMDNPSLTVRRVAGPNPRRFVLDRCGTLPKSLKLFSDGLPTTAVVGPRAAPAYAALLRACGGSLLQVPEREGHLDLQHLLEHMSLQSLLVEAGPGLATALLRQDLVDRLFVFIAPKVLGGGIPSFDGLGITTLTDALTFAEHVWEDDGYNMLLRGYLRAV